jgi:hypothetical protein
MVDGVKRNDVLLEKIIPAGQSNKNTQGSVVWVKDKPPRNNNYYVMLPINKAEAAKLKHPDDTPFWEQGKDTLESFLNTANYDNGEERCCAPNVSMQFETVSKRGKRQPISGWKFQLVALSDMSRGTEMTGEYAIEEYLDHDDLVDLTSMETEQLPSSVDLKKRNDDLSALRDTLDRVQKEKEALQGKMQVDSQVVSVLQKELNELKEMNKKLLVIIIVHVLVLFFVSVHYLFYFLIF